MIRRKKWISIPRDKIHDIVDMLYEKMYTEYNTSSTMFKYDEWIAIFCIPEMKLIRYFQDLL